MNEADFLTNCQFLEIPNQDWFNLVNLSSSSLFYDFIKYTGGCARSEMLFHRTANLETGR